MALVTFNGTTKIITVNSGVTSLSVQDDLYSDWKSWALLNPGYEAAFRAVGGDELQTNYFLASTYFLLNGWRIRPAEEDRILNVIGNLFVDGSSDSPFIPTIGTFRVMVNSTTSNIVNTIAVGSGVTNQDKTDIISGVTVELNLQTTDILDGVEADLDITRDEILDGVEADLDITRDEILDGVSANLDTVQTNIIDALQPDLKMILGLCHNNFRFYDQTYDTNGNLTYGKVRIYTSSGDCNTDTSPLASWEVNAGYSNGKLTSYKVTNDV